MIKTELRCEGQKQHRNLPGKSNSNPGEDGLLNYLQESALAHTIPW